MYKQTKSMLGLTLKDFYYYIATSDELQNVIDDMYSGFKSDIYYNIGVDPKGEFKLFGPYPAYYETPDTISFEEVGCHHIASMEYKCYLLEILKYLSIGEANEFYKEIVKDPATSDKRDMYLRIGSKLSINQAITFYPQVAINVFREKFPQYASNLPKMYMNFLEDELFVDLRNQFMASYNFYFDYY